MSQYSHSNFDYVSRLFLRGLGLVYLIAFSSLWVQLYSLFSSRGISPINETLSRLSAEYGLWGFFKAPSIFWFIDTNSALLMTCVAGMIFSAWVAFGLFQRIYLIISWIAYLSFVTLGAPFLSFQWDYLLLEISFLTLCLSALGTRSLTVWLYRLLLIRLMLSSGLVKLYSGDYSWWNLTALDYHYFTQPLPHYVSWLVHQLPAWFQSLSVLIMFIIELVFPFFILLSNRLRYIGVYGIVGLMICIMLTGNYGFFNILVIFI